LVSFASVTLTDILPSTFLVEGHARVVRQEGQWYSLQSVPDAYLPISTGAMRVKRTCT
jgi:hypothetical protein